MSGQESPSITCPRRQVSTTIGRFAGGFCASRHLTMNPNGAH